MRRAAANGRLRSVLRFLPATVLGATLLTAGGCQGDERGVDDEVAPPVRPSPSPYEPGIDPASGGPSLAEADVAAVVPVAIDLAAAVEPGAIAAAFEAMMVHADEVCPERQASTGPNGEVAIYWTQFEPCTATDGTVFRGAVRYSATPQILDDGLSVTQILLSSEGTTFEVETPDGRFLGGSVYLESESGGPATDRYHQMYIAGELMADAATAGAHAWLSGRVRGTIAQYAGESEGGRYRGLTGSIATFDGLGGIGAVSFDEWVALRYGCDGVAGAMALRAADAGWHDVVFAPPESEDIDLICDACADLSFHGEPLGQACTDIALVDTMLGWQGAPW